MNIFVITFSISRATAGTTHGFYSCVNVMFLPFPITCLGALFFYMYSIYRKYSDRHEQQCTPRSDTTEHDV